MEVGAFGGQLIQGFAFPFAGVAAVYQFHLRVVTQVAVKPGQRFFHRNAVGAGKAGKIRSRHFGKLGHFLVGHAGIAKAGNVQVQLFGGVKAEFLAQGFLILKVALELRPQKVHHHSAGHGGVLGIHAMGL